MTVQTEATTKFSLNGEQLKVIQTAIKGLKHSRKETILTNVRFNVSNYEVTFEAVDKDNHVLLTFPINNQAEGMMVIDKSVLKDLKMGKNDTVEFETEHDQIKISVNGLTTLRPKETEFCEPLAYENGLTFNVNSRYVKSLGNALKFVSQSEIRPVLQGISHTENHIVCTDSHKLYKCGDLHTFKDGNFTLHSSTAKLVFDLMKTKKSDILMSVSANENQVRYETGNVVITGNIIDGSFPVTRNMFPQNFRTELHLNENEVKEMAKTIKAMLPYTTKDTSTIKFKISDNSLTIISLNMTEKTVGEEVVREHVETSKIVYENLNTQGEDIKIAMNGNDLLIALEQQKGEGLNIKFTGLCPHS